MYVCNRIENDSDEEPEELAGKAPEQQSVGGGKCPVGFMLRRHVHILKNRQGNLQ